MLSIFQEKEPLIPERTILNKKQCKQTINYNNNNNIIIIIINTVKWLKKPYYQELYKGSVE